MFHAFRCEFTSIFFFLPLCSSLPLLFLASLSEHCLLFLISGGDRELHVGSHRIVRTWVMYSAPVPCFHFRAASFLLAGYTNCSISILRQAVTGSWGFNGHCMPPSPSLHRTFEQTKCAVCTMCMFLHLSWNDRSYNMFIPMLRSLRTSHFSWQSV